MRLPVGLVQLAGGFTNDLKVATDGIQDDGRGGPPSGMSSRVLHNALRAVADMDEIKLWIFGGHDSQPNGFRNHAIPDIRMKTTGLDEIHLCL